MNKTLMGLALAGAVASPSLLASYDGSVTVTAGNYQAGNGGEFKAVTTPSLGKINLGTFQTFCIELNEHLSFGGTYNYRINSGAVAGGTSETVALDPNTGLSMDNISAGTAYLYANYRAGNAGFTVGSLTDAANLQNAIWYLENEIGSIGGANPYYNAAIAHYTTLAAARADSGGAYGVVALNLFTGNDEVHQDVLGIVPEPTTLVAGALMALPFGASVVRVLRRKS